MHKSNSILQDFSKVLNGLSDARIMVIGDVMLDRFIWGKVERISPEAPVPVVWVKNESAMPGGAANVARNVSAIGAKAFLAGVIGNDSDGLFIKDILNKFSINTSMLIKDAKRPTTVKTRVVAHNQQVVRIDKEELSPLSTDIIDKLWLKISKKLPQVDIIIIEDYGKGVITKRLLSRVISAAHKLGKLIAVDPKKDHFEFYKKADIITPNRKELSDALGGIRLDNIKDVDIAAKKLIKKLQIKSLLVTLSEDGMKLYYGDKSHHVPTSAKEVYDVSGAGDTVIAVFSACRAIGIDPIIATTIANAAAGVVVGKIGVATASIDEIYNKLQ